MITLAILCTALALEINPIPLFPTYNPDLNSTVNTSDIVNSNDTLTNITDVISNSTDIVPVDIIDTNVTINSTGMNNTNNTTNNTDSSHLPSIDKNHITHGGTPMQDSPRERSNYDNGYTDQQRPAQIRNGGTKVE
jgi:hypothetical protein